MSAIISHVYVGVFAGFPFYMKHH